MNTSFESRISAIESRNALVQYDVGAQNSVPRVQNIEPLRENWYLHALVPTCGYFLSTLALPAIRKMWEVIK